MCTLTYIPLKGQQIITSNRDEHESRGDSLFPVTITKNGLSITFPQDPLAGGTWLATSKNGIVTVLLNGAFEKHKHQPPYRLSRGILLLDSYTFKDLHEFTSQYDLLNIEPFTMVQFQLSNSLITEVRWDGSKSYLKDYDHTVPHIWSSSSLYSKEVRLQRERWFKEWIQSNRNDAASMLKFHQFGGEGKNDNTITMNRGNGLKTVSISQIVRSSSKTSFQHDNLISEKSAQVVI